MDERPDEQKILARRRFSAVGLPTLAGNSSATKFVSSQNKPIMPCIIRQIVLFVLLILVSPVLMAQQFSLSRLFYPNITLKAEYVPETTFGDNQRFGYNRTSFQGMLPLRSEVEAGIGFRKKLDLQARHTLMLANFTQLNPTLNGTTQPNSGFKTASVGLVMLKASLRDKLWVYAGGGGITESNETFFTPQPFLWGGAARMRILGLQTQLVYGSVIVYNQKFRVVPVFGLNKKINKHWKVSALLPFQADARYSPNKWLAFDMIGAVGGYSAGFQEISGSEKLLRRQNYQHVKFSLAASAHVLNVLNVSLEAGLTTFRQVRVFNSSRENLLSYAPAPAPFLSASVRYITNKSKLSSKFVNKLGLGGI